MPTFSFSFGFVCLWQKVGIKKRRETNETEANEPEEENKRKSPLRGVKLQEIKSRDKEKLFLPKEEITTTEFISLKKHFFLPLEENKLFFTLFFQRKKQRTKAWVNYKKYPCGSILASNPMYML